MLNLAPPPPPPQCHVIDGVELILIIFHVCLLKMNELSNGLGVANWVIVAQTERSFSRTKLHVFIH